MGDVLKRKIDCAKEFVEQILRRLGGRVYKVVLFGSVAKGTADADSDVDVLVVVDNATEDVREVVAEASFQVGLKYNESVEYLVMGLEEYKSRGLDNPLIYEVERWGEVLYEDPEPEVRRALKLVELAEEYYGYAERCMQSLMYRAAVDLGQNAVELLLKASILARGGPLPRTHGGYIQKFGELYVLSGKVGREVVSKLYRALELRNRARYDPDYSPSETDVAEVLQLYRELKDVVGRMLSREDATNGGRLEVHDT